MCWCQSHLRRRCAPARDLQSKADASRSQRVAPVLRGRLAPGQVDGESEGWSCTRSSPTRSNPMNGRDRARRPVWIGLIVLGGLAFPLAARAQHEHHRPPASPDTVGNATATVRAHGGHGVPVDHGGHGGHDMRGLYGPYGMSREASGTSWQPDQARHDGLHHSAGSWMLMVHGTTDLAWTDQGGPRGDDDVFATNMIMGVARRPVGPLTVGLRAMLSAEPATIGKEGYPLLLQTGETADGETPLIDRQHPHDLFMELAGTLSLGLGGDGRSSVFFYGGLPGEPALGPPAFMHRFSGTGVPVAPLSHHWLDSSHITFGVVTGGLVIGRAKLEASAFRGREPDERRWNIESPRLDSHAFRMSVNPAARWALQVSRGRLTGPEQLEPGVDVDRTTASVLYESGLGGDGGAGRFGATLAWGRNENRPGPTLDAFAVEAAVELRGGRHTLFGRAERVEKNELFPESDPRAGQVYEVGAVTGGYRLDFWRPGPWRFGIGGATTLTFVPGELRETYGRRPGSTVLFLRATLRGAS